MKATRVIQLVLTVAACVFALIIAVGCSSAASSGSASGSGSASSASASSDASASVSSSASSASQSSAASSVASSKSSSASSSSGQMTVEDAKVQGYQVFEGTVRVANAEELIKLQAIDIDPAVAGGGGGTYAVLVFDQATDVTGESADGSGQRTESANMLGIAEHTDYSSFVVEYGDLDACKALDGQHVTLAAKATDIMFPSDVSLPIGQPKANVSIILP